MEPISIYLAGVILTTLAAPAAGLTGVIAGVTSHSGMSAGGLALTWPVSLPVLAGAATMTGIEHVLTPAEPEHRDLIALNSPTPPAVQYVHCETHAIDADAIEQAGGYHAFSRSFALEKLGSNPAGMIATTNWRAGTVFTDPAAAIPKATGDWVGNYTTDAGQPVADLRVCTLKLKTNWGQQ